MKTNRSAAKRIKRTGSGKLKRYKSMHSHILTKKTTKRKRNLRKSTLVAEVNKRKLGVLLPE
jgi:large subunit ribosomal protein L35